MKLALVFVALFFLSAQQTTTQGEPTVTGGGWGQVMQHPPKGMCDKGSRRVCMLHLVTMQGTQIEGEADLS